MKAILLADMAVELFSTDIPPSGVSLVNDDYQTRKCHCRIRDVACLGWFDGSNEIAGMLLVIMLPNLVNHAWKLAITATFGCFTLIMSEVLSE